MLYPVILCGGNGTRLWPMSRSFYPKQFMELNGHTLFGDTLDRCRALPEAASPVVICNEEHRFYVAASLQERGLRGPVFLEPEGRNTAPAIALAALQALEDAGNGEKPLLLVLPSDHVLQPESVFIQGVRRALPAAEAGCLLTFGIQPSEPATGFGYIVRGDVLTVENGGSRGPAGNAENTADPGECFHVRQFQEKPDEAKARALIGAGGCYWNSGMFLFRADVYLDSLHRFAPELADAVTAAWEKRRTDYDFIRPDADLFRACPADSIDYAVMEHTDKAAVVPLAVNWSDLGSWEAFYQHTPKDAEGNASVGDVLLEQSRDCYLRSTGRLVAALGLENIAVVETADAVLVADRDKLQDVKHIVSSLKKENRTECSLHPRVYRPWGSYESLARGSRFQVKRIVVNPGSSLSLQKHRYRAEHWVVVEGVAGIRIDDTTFLLKENESAYIPQGSLHRLKNPGETPLIIVEIQSGSYLGEDDIIRVEDNYGRVAKEPALE